MVHPTEAEALKAVEEEERLFVATDGIFGIHRAYAAYDEFKKGWIVRTRPNIPGTCT